VVCRGIEYESVANVEGTKMCFHVPAASLKALAPSDNVAETWKHIPVLPWRRQGGGGGIEAAWPLVWPLAWPFAPVAGVSGAGVLFVARK